MLQTLLPDLTEDFRAHLLDVVANLQNRQADEYDRVRDKMALDAGIRNVIPPHRRKVNRPDASDAADSAKGEEGNQ